MVVVTCLGTWKADNTGAPPIPPKRGQRGPGLPFGACAFWLMRDAARRPGRQAAGRGPVQARHCTHRGDLLPPEAVGRAPSLALPGTVAEPWRRLTARKRGKQLSPKTHRIAL